MTSTQRIVVAIVGGLLAFTAVCALLLYSFFTQSPPFDLTRPKARRKTNLDDDRTGFPYPASPFAGDVDLDVMGAAVDSLNDRCLGSWCDGSYEIAFLDLACDSKKEICDLELRFYATVRGEPMSRVIGVHGEGPWWRGKVLEQRSPARCAPARLKGRELDRPCAIMDVRCELLPNERIDPSAFARRARETGVALPADWHALISRCIDSMRRSVREFAPPEPK